MHFAERWVASDRDAGDPTRTGLLAWRWAGADVVRGPGAVWQNVKSGAWLLSLLNTDGLRPALSLRTSGTSEVWEGW
jgi:hypothetical protein